MCDHEHRLCWMRGGVKDQRPKEHYLQQIGTSHFPPPFGVVYTWTIKLVHYSSIVPFIWSVLYQRSHGMCVHVTVHLGHP